MKRWVFPLETFVQRRGGDDPRAIGGKAARLVWLARNKFAIPETWVVSKEAFSHAIRTLPPGSDPKSLLRVAMGRFSDARIAEARGEFLRLALPPGLLDELTALCAGASSPWGFAVRSSATCEDGAVVSMAGVAESVLGVRGANDLGQAILAVWGSIATGRALGYLAAHGVRDVSMAVVIQPMVQAEAAGVMFTRTAPVEDRLVALGRDERIVNAAIGLGAPVVNGMVTPDVLRIDTRGRVIDAAIAHKPKALSIGERGPIEVDVSSPDQPALNAAQVAELAAIAARLERLEAVAWDVEFVADKQKVWLVQARPATGRVYPEGGDAETIWSNANVGEALPGVATPLTWSVAGAFSDSGFRAAFETLGCRVPKNAKLVGNVYGRFYLNLSQFLAIAAQVPWVDPHMLVELGGGLPPDRMHSPVPRTSKRRFFLRAPLTVARFVREQMRLESDVARFEEYAADVQKDHNALDLAILTDTGLARRIRDTQLLLTQAGSVMLTCAASSLGSHLALRMLLERLSPIGAEPICQSLTTGVGDLESARPASAIMQIAQLARQEAPAREAIEADAAGLDAIPEGGARRALASFLDLYGDRGVREAELATPRWREDVPAVLDMVRAALRGEGRDVEAALEAARKHADEELEKLMPQFGIIEQVAVRHLVARARKSARLREQMRAWVTHVLWMIRQALLDADRRLSRRDATLHSEQAALSETGLAIGQIPAVFFLTIDEVVNALNGTNVDLAALVRARRSEYARDQARPEPPSTFVGAPRSLVMPVSSRGLMRGLPGSSGVVEGRARVLTSIAEVGELEPGEILVVRTTDVGWTPLFLVAAGVVTELGGGLSHAVIVAREFGVPAVVNVEGATRAIRTGEWLRIDGDRGYVDRIARG